MKSFFAAENGREGVEGVEQRRKKSNHEQTKAQRHVAVPKIIGAKRPRAERGHDIPFILQAHRLVKNTLVAARNCLGDRGIHASQGKVADYARKRQQILVGAVRLFGKKVRERDIEDEGEKRY